MISIYQTMSLKKVALAAAFAVSAASFAVSAGGVASAADLPVKAVPKKVKEVPFFFVNDTSVSFVWYPGWTNPGIPGSSAIVAGGIAGQKNNFNLYQTSIDHFDVWEYGTNFIHSEFNLSDGEDPVQGTPGAIGSREIFGFWTGTLGFNELSHSKTFETVFTKDVSFMLVLTGGEHDDFLASEVTQVAPGIQFTLNLPGIVNVGITAQKEWTHNEDDACGTLSFGNAVGGGNGACVGGGSFSGNRTFETTWKLFTLISEPLTFLPPSLPLTFINILNLTGPKGTGISTANCNAIGFGGSCTAPNPFVLGNPSAFQNNETKTEIFEDARLSLDASKVFWGKPGIWDAFVGYRFWENKFGTNHNAPLFAIAAPDSSKQSTAYLGTTYHFH